MAIDSDAIREAVAIRHGIVISPDDPILTFLAVHETMLDLYAERFEEAGMTVLKAWQTQAQNDRQTIAQSNLDLQAALRDELRNAIAQQTSAWKSMLRHYADNTQRSYDHALHAQHRILKISLVTFGASIAALTAALIDLMVR